MAIQSNRYACHFLLSTIRLDWAIFDFQNWFIQKVQAQNNSFIFCKRGKRKELLEAIEMNYDFKECFQTFDKVVFLAKEQHPTISCNYDTSKAILTMPNKEWWNFHNLENEFKKLADWFIKSFKMQ